jgi:pullulanase/glycogen debranching enzyme
MQLASTALEPGKTFSPGAATKPGKSFPLGASLVAEGANFSVFSKHASAVQLLLFDNVDDDRPSKVIDLDPHAGRTYHYWHCFMPALKAGQLYGYRAHGPYAPEKGLRFDANKVLLDPYGKCVARPSRVSRDAARSPGDNTATALKSVLADPSAYEWKEGIDQPATLLAHEQGQAGPSMDTKESAELARFILFCYDAVWRHVR